MAYDGQYTTIKPVVDRVFRDSGHDEVDWESAIDWTIQLIGKLGVPAQYISITTNGVGYNPNPLPVENYRAILPNGIVNIESCRRVLVDNQGTIVDFRPMIESSDIYHNTQIESDTQQPTSYDPVAHITNLDLKSDNELDYSRSYINQEKLEYPSGLPYTYKIQGDIIFTNFKEGNIEMVYRSYPIDSEGFPMIPDDEKYLAALEYYITYKLDWKKWRKHPASPGLKALVNDSEQQYLWYVGAAQTKGRIPTVDGMEKLKNAWVRSIPKINEHANGFKSLSAPEVRYNNFPRKS